MSAAYREVLPLARGGMGRVMVAVRQHQEFERLYALKRLHPVLTEDEGVVTQFLDEARIAGLVRHTNVVAVTDFGRDEAGPYLVMEWVDGVPLGVVLKDLASSRELLPLSVCIEIGRQIALGLHAVHELTDHDGHNLEVVHRDVSPQNVLIGFDGAVKVTDFGIAKALNRQTQTSTGTLKGKLGYMSPEQLQYLPVDRRSDLFALGTVLFELMTSKRLYKEGPAAILREVVPDLGEFREDAPDGLVELMMDLLAKDPALRPDSALAVAERLRDLGRDLATFEDEPDLPAFLTERYGERRAALRAEIARALREPEPAREADSKQPRWLPIVAIGATAAALTLGVLVVMEDEPRPSPPPQAPPASVAAPTVDTHVIRAIPAPEAEEPTVVPDDEQPEVAEQVSDEEERQASTETEAGEDDDSTPRRDRRDRRRRRRPRGRTEQSPSRTDGPTRPQAWTQWP